MWLYLVIWVLSGAIWRYLAEVGSALAARAAGGAAAGGALWAIDQRRPPFPI